MDKEIITKGWPKGKEMQYSKRGPIDHYRDKAVTDEMLKEISLVQTKLSQKIIIEPDLSERETVVLKQYRTYIGTFASPELNRFFERLKNIK